MQYDASTIEALEGLEPVRRRPAVYIGDAGQAGLNRLVAKLIGNAVGEVTEGFATRVLVQVSGDSMRVQDDGRGIPVGRNRYTSALELIFTSLHSGCDCGCDEPPGHREGDHAFPLSVVNGLSAWLEVETVREGRLHSMRFTQGVVDQPLKDHGATERRGTRITFAPDRSIFGREPALATPWLREHVAQVAREFGADIDLLVA